AVEIATSGRQAGPAGAIRLVRPLRVAGLLGLALLTLGACSPPRGLEAMRVLADVAAGDQPSRLKARTPEPRRVALAGAGPEGLLGDLYWPGEPAAARSEEHTSELQSRENLVCRLL